MMKSRLVIANMVVATGLSMGSARLVASEPTFFRNEGLKNETVVRLEVDGKSVNGTFASAQYGEEAVPHRFVGEVVATPKGRRGVYMEVRFEGDIPYSAPPDTKALRWHLKIVDHRAHLFIPMQEQAYTGKTRKWVVFDVELLPD